MAIINSFTCTVSRYPILTTKVDPHAVGVNCYPADRDYWHFQSVLLVDQSTVIGNEMCV